jgi:mannose/fructose/N-acetylgalactosamine-specific phosphotransferase system component IID
MTDQIVVKKVTQKDLDKAWWNWMFFWASAFSMERMQAIAFVHCMRPILDRLYGLDNKVEITAACKRHMVFFNTEPQTGVIANGVTIALEEQRANGAPIDDEMINAVKAGIMGPMAGIGDSMIPGTLIPILLAIGMGLSQNGSPLGAIFYIISYLTIMLLLSHWLFNLGYRYGTDVMGQLASGSFRKVTSTMAVLGLIVAGGIGASIISLNTPLGFAQGELRVSLQDTLNSIFPALLPLLLTLWLWRGMRTKGWPINKALGMVFLVIAIGYLPGLIASLFGIPALEQFRIF